MARYRVNIHTVLPLEEDGPIRLLGGTVDASVDIETNNFSYLKEYFQEFFDEFIERDGLEEYKIEWFVQNASGEFESVGGREVTPLSKG